MLIENVCQIDLNSNGIWRQFYLIWSRAEWNIEHWNWRRTPNTPNTFQRWTRENKNALYTRIKWAFRYGDVKSILFHFLWHKHASIKYAPTVFKVWFVSLANNFPLKHFPISIKSKRMPTGRETRREKMRTHFHIISLLIH